MSKQKRWPLGDYGLSIVLTILFLVSWAIQSVAGWAKFAAEERQHGQTPEMSGYMSHWLEATFENWQSEFLQLLTFVILTAIFIHKGSHESKDEDVKVEEQLNRIEEKLDRLEKAQRGDQNH
jgi:hypothetical protein